MLQENIFTFKSNGFTIELKLNQDLLLTATHDEEPIILIAQYSNTNMPERVKQLFDNVTEFFQYIKEHSTEMQCVEGLGLKTFLQVSRLNRKQLIIPLERIQMPENVQSSRLQIKAEKTIQALLEQNNQLKRKIIQLQTNQSYLQRKILQYERNKQSEEWIFERPEKEQQPFDRHALLQVKNKIKPIQSVKNHRINGKLQLVFQPDQSIVGDDIEYVGRSYIKRGMYGILLVNKNYFIHPVSSISFKVVKSKYKSMYIGVICNFREGQQPQWAGRQSCFLQIEGGKRAFKSWDLYQDQIIEAVNTGQTVTITVNYNIGQIIWSKDTHKLCSCILPRTNLYAFVRMKEEGDIIEQVI